MPFFGAAPGDQPTFVLEWTEGDSFAMRERFGYRDAETGDMFIVPRDLGRFATDFASVPSQLTWLVPRIGSHLPAAVLHDALVSDPDAPTDHLGPEVEREEADKIFRVAMRELDVPTIRRWLMWLGVSAGTAFSERRSRWYLGVAL